MRQFDSKQIISASMDEIRIWDFKTHECRMVISSDYVSCIHLSENSFVVGKENGMVQVFSLRGKLLNQCQLTFASIVHIQAFTSHPSIIAVDQNGTILTLNHHEAIWKNEDRAYLIELRNGCEVDVLIKGFQKSLSLDKGEMLNQIQSSIYRYLE
jgi:WD40 repeat protein